METRVKLNYEDIGSLITLLHLIITFQDDKMYLDIKRES